MKALRSISPASGPSPHRIQMALRKVAPHHMSHTRRGSKHSHRIQQLHHLLRESPRLICKRRDVPGQSYATMSADCFVFHDYSFCRLKMLWAFTALPPDVRKGSAFPALPLYIMRLRLFSKRCDQYSSSRVHLQAGTPAKFERSTSGNLPPARRDRPAQDFDECNSLFA